MQPKCAISIPLPPDLYNLLTRTCGASRVPVSRFVRSLIEQALIKPRPTTHIDTRLPPLKEPAQPSIRLIEEKLDIAIKEQSEAPAVPLKPYPTMIGMLPEEAGAGAGAGAGAVADPAQSQNAGKERC